MYRIIVLYMQINTIYMDKSIEYVLKVVDLIKLYVLPNFHLKTSKNF